MCLAWVGQAMSSESLLVGIATGNLIAHKSSASHIGAFDDRKKALLAFLAMIKPDLQGTSIFFPLLLISSRDFIL
jgi:phosphopantetheine adenylyltransferase